jgi:hypothetical protein
MQKLSISQVFLEEKNQWHKDDSSKTSKMGLEMSITPEVLRSMVQDILKTRFTVDDEEKFEAVTNTIVNALWQKYYMNTDIFEDVTNILFYSIMLNINGLLKEDPSGGKKISLDKKEIDNLRNEYKNSIYRTVK